jgi:hypothetical protein
MKRKEVLNRIQAIYTKLENDSLGANEIEELVDLSNNLYERALILRYKVAEQRIFGKKTDLSTNEIADDTDELSQVSIKNVEIPAAIDFSIFEAEEEQVLENDAVDQEDSIFETVLKEPVTVELNFQVGISEPEETGILPETKTESEADVLSSGDWSPTFDKIVADYSTSIDQKIETLAGSFGLNERILFINELFNGDAEKFSNAVLQLDKMEDWNSGKSFLNKLANQENWEKDSDTIGEFVLHVKRKHA